MKSFHVLRIAAPLAAVALLAATRVPMSDGWKFGWKVTIDSVEGRVPPQQSMQVQMIPGHIRMDFVGQPQPGTKKGAYILFDADAGTMAMVSPEDKTAILMEPGAIGTMAGAVGSVVKMDVSDVKVNVEDLGAGEKILGRTTHKYRVTRSYAMQLSVFGKKVKSSHVGVTESWLNKEMLTTDKSWEAWGEKFSGGATRLGGDAFKKLMEAEKDVPRGVPLRQVMSSADTDDKGNVTRSRSTWEMTELRKSDIAAAAFEIPSDYAVTDMKQAVAETEKAMQQAKSECDREHGKGAKECDPSQLNVDSLVAAARQGAAEGMKEGMKEGAKETAKDAIKKGLFGKLRRP